MNSQHDFILREGVEHIRAQVPFYRKLLANLEAVKGLQDLPRLPFTTKADLRAQAPWGMLANPNVVRVHASSGSSGGDPTLMAYTRRDLELWTQLTARALAFSGVRHNTRVHCSYGYGLFTGGMGFHAGAEALEALTVPAGSMDPAQQVRMMVQIQPEVLLATPTGAVTLLETALELGVDPRQLGLETGVFGGEAWTEELRSVLESGFGIEAFDTYGLSEILGPGVAHECGWHCGLHIDEDHFIAEVIDPVSSEVLPVGELGELVLTALTKEAMPLLRYRTGDLTRLNEAPCPCGDRNVRMDRVQARMGEPYPWMKIEKALLSLPGGTSHFRILPKTCIQFELELFGTLKQQEVEHQFEVLLKDLGIDIPAWAVEPKNLGRSMGKTNR